MINPVERSFWETESKEAASCMARVLKKNRFEVGSMYLALKFLMEDLKKQHPLCEELDEPMFVDSNGLVIK